MTARLDALIESLVARGHRGMVLGLDRTLGALAALGRPERDLQAIVVAGSNGKGSVSAMLERIAREAGLKTGLYTSPHLVRYNERIRFDGAPISDEAFEDALGKVLTDGPSDPTFFETLTLAAFVAFREQDVDLAILEVGLGGRLDSTNVLDDPLCTAIVSITEGAGGKHLEHADLLGNTVAQIAREKAGILRSTSPLALGPLESEALSSILERASELGTKPVWKVALEASERSSGGSTTSSVETARLQVDEKALLQLPDGTCYEIAPALRGRHQLVNAAVAATTAHLAGLRRPELRAAISNGISKATWPGRLERIASEARGISIWLDCAHNIDGARALLEAWPGLGHGPAQTTLLFGALADKSYEPFLTLVAPVAHRRIYTEPGGRAPAPLDELSRIAEGEAFSRPEEALIEALRRTPDGGALLVTGSIYLVGAIRALLFQEKRDPALGL